MTREDGCDYFKLFLADCWRLAVTSPNWFLLIAEDWFWLVQTCSYCLLKLALTSSNWLSLLIVETACEQIQTGISAWLLKLNVTSSNQVLSWLLKLALTSSNWFLLIVETSSNKIKRSSYWLCMTREDHCHLFKLVFTASCWNWAVTISNWFLLSHITSSNWFMLIVETSCKLVPNWFLLIVETGCETRSDQFVTECAWQEKIIVTSSNWFLLIVETGSELVQTTSYWLLKLPVTS